MNVELGIHERSVEQLFTCLLDLIFMISLRFVVFIGYAGRIILLGSLSIQGLYTTQPSGAMLSTSTWLALHS